MSAGKMLLILIFSTGCVHEPFRQMTTKQADDCAGVTPAFSKDIYPIMSSSCAKSGCHDGNTMPLDFSIYANIKHYLDDSAIYYSVVINKTMPEDVPLDSEQFKEIKCWLKSGYPDN